MDTDFFDTTFVQLTTYEAALRSIGGAESVALADRLRDLAELCQAEINSGRRRGRVEAWRVRLKEVASRVSAMPKAKRDALQLAVEEIESRESP